VLPPEEACLAKAFTERRAAELLIEQNSIEGDPIPRTLFVDVRDGAATLTVIMDSSADRFGGDPAVSTQECSRVTTTRGTCAELGYDTCTAGVD
jgi:hypothetical protein